MEHFNQVGSPESQKCEGIRRIMTASEGAFAMREWLFVIAPLAVIGFFLAYPDQLRVFMDLFYGVFH